MKPQEIIIGNDHAAIDIKYKLLRYLELKGHKVMNIGTNNDCSTHYPYYAFKAANLLLNQPENYKAILLCGTGIGISIAANKIKGIRCMVCHTPFLAKIAREQFDINMLGLGARVTGPGLLETIVDTFLKTPFDFINSDKKKILNDMLFQKDLENIEW